MQIAFSESCSIKSSTGWAAACRAEACGWEGIIVEVMCMAMAEPPFR